MEERTVAPDDVVIQQGDDGDNFYIIETWVRESNFKCIIQNCSVVPMIYWLAIQKSASTMIRASSASWH